MNRTFEFGTQNLECGIQGGGGEVFGLSKSFALPRLTFPQVSTQPLIFWSREFDGRSVVRNMFIFRILCTWINNLLQVVEIPRVATRLKKSDVCCSLRMVCMCVCKWLKFRDLPPFSAIFRGFSALNHMIFRGLWKIWGDFFTGANEGGAPIWMKMRLSAESRYG
jgi:hypothetical protein